jgi:hypothetical protein
MPLEHGLSPPRAPRPGQRPGPQGPRKREGRGGGVAHHPVRGGRERHGEGREKKGGGIEAVGCDPQAAPRARRARWASPAWPAALPPHTFGWPARGGPRAGVRAGVWDVCVYRATVMGRWGGGSGTPWPGGGPGGEQRRRRPRRRTTVPPVDTPSPLIYGSNHHRVMRQPCRALLVVGPIAQHPPQGMVKVGGSYRGGCCRIES